MAGFFSRLFRVAQSEAHSVVDKLEDPIKLTEQGKRQVVKMLTDADQGTWRAARRRHELVEQALGAIQCFRRGEQYELVDGRVMMIDQFTGRSLIRVSLGTGNTLSSSIQPAQPI